MTRHVFGPIEVQSALRSVRLGGQPVALGARAFDLLLALVERRDRVVGKDELLAAAWPGLVVEESNLTVQIAALRKALGAEAITTVPGVGYRFTAADNTSRETASPATPTPTARDADRERPSLAVMPFANLSGDAAQDYFVDGVVDDLTTALSRVRRFFVIARSSSFTYKGRVVDVPTVGRELGVRYLLEGSFRAAGDHVRITTQLVETAAGRQLWSQRFEGRRNQIFELQDRITEQVVAAIEPSLVLAEADRAARKPTDNLEAYDWCQRALPLVMLSATQADVRQAIAWLERALEADPGYAYAKALCGWAHVMGMANRWLNNAEAEAALPYAEQAHLHHRDDAATLAYAGHTLSLLGRRHAEALSALDLALAINPNSMLALRSSGYVRAYAGDCERAIADFERALRLNPLDPEIAYVWCGMAFARLQLGQPEEALALARRAISQTPSFGPSYLAEAYALNACGRHDELERFRQLVCNDLRYPSVAEYERASPWVSPAFRTLCVDTMRRLGVAEG